MQDGGAKNGWETYDFSQLYADCAASAIADAERAIASLYAGRHENYHVRGTLWMLLNNIPRQILETVCAHLVKKNPSLQKFLKVGNDSLLFGQEAPDHGAHY